ncbi:MAG: hypothetical protein IPL79_07770 [Myxococcales bacterium]|nr:hypothetical protein [Myxococcales bacterium]
MTSRRLALLAWWVACAGVAGATGCKSPPPAMQIIVPPARAGAMEPYVALLPSQLDAALTVREQPDLALGESASRTQIAVVIDDAMCAECFRLREAPGGFVVEASDSLGAQYGVSALLEAMGVRFFHPHQTFVPATLAVPDAAILDRVESPQVARRGVHLHILHPTEAYFDFWEPGDENLADAARTLDWLVKNRANFVTWPLLDDMFANAAQGPSPRLAHQRQLLTLAHARGLRVGAGLQVFGASNLQHAYDLVEADEAPAEAIPARLAPLAELPYDSLQLSFGEFFSEEPSAFIAAVEQTYDAVQAAWPSAEVTASIHVGNFEDTRVIYEEESLLYYFLVKFAARPIVPWMHSVMYYGLFGDAGGAYNHETFAEHRAYLLERLALGEPAGYFPETAYWVAFDNSIPQYLPLYMRARYDDLASLATAAAQGGHAGLQDHVIFSSGWEWGYWQNDWAALRMGWALPASYEALLGDMFAPLGVAGQAAASLVAELTELQQGAHIDQRLAPYLASQDVTFAAGYALGVWSQPRRPDLEEIIDATPEVRAQFAADVLTPLAAFADELAVLATQANAPAFANSAATPFIAELIDGVEIAATRAAFAHALWLAAASSGAPDARDAALAEVDAQLAAAELVVRRRHAALMEPSPSTILARSISTSLLYQYGYLREADTLCFWHRERAQLRNAMLGETTAVPACVL